MSSGFLPRHKQPDYEVHLGVQHAKIGGKTEKEEGGEGKTQGVALPDIKTNIKCIIGV